ncbi:MAG: hypothetical protein JXB00_08355 [Bacteroidales bacterium]|nr:hypothetical protein [Bacteroidales bacterium]
MANIRKLKKEIKYLTADLVDECKNFFVFHPAPDTRKRDEITAKIVKKEKEIINEINHLKKNAPAKAKAYANQIVEKVRKELVPILDELGKISGN